MNLPLRQTLSRHRFMFQRELLPWLEETVGSLGERYRLLVRVLELVQPKELSRLERQASMTLEQMLEELPKTCDIGVKSTGKEYLERLTGDEPPLPLRPRIPTRSWRISSRSLSDHGGASRQRGAPWVISSAHRQARSQAGRLTHFPGPVALTFLQSHWGLGGKPSSNVTSTVWVTSRLGLRAVRV